METEQKDNSQNEEKKEIQKDIKDNENNEKINNEKNNEQINNVNDIIEENKRLKDEIEKLKEENKKLNEESKELKDQNKKLIEENKKLKQELKPEKKELKNDLEEKEKEDNNENLENKNENKNNEKSPLNSKEETKEIKEETNKQSTEKKDNNMNEEKIKDVSEKEELKEEKKEEVKEELKEEKKEEVKEEIKLEEKVEKSEQKDAELKEDKEIKKEAQKEDAKGDQSKTPENKENQEKEEGLQKESKDQPEKKGEVKEEIEESKGFNKEAFISQVEGKMQDKYEIIKELGSGAFSRCLQVKNKTTGNLYACKEIQKKKMSDLEGFKHEINILIKLDHPNIIKLYEIYETEEFFYLIMELCSGGELFDRIISNIESGKPFTEEQAAVIFQQMMSAINYCHKNNIVHRDLKPENLLCLNQSPNSPIKVIDFGMSKICDPNDIMFERVGTAYYIPPEVLEGMYDEKCDVWSAGVILYILLCGYPCFNGETDEQIYRQIRKKKFDFPSPEWDNISDDAKNLIKKMLIDAVDRISAEEVLKDPWVLNLAPNAKKGGIVQINENQLKNYAASSKMRKAVLTYIASRLTQNEIEELNKNFQEIDDNNDGKLTLEEIKQAVNKNKNINIEHIEEIFKSIDTDGSGSIEYTEFISASLDKSLYLQKEKLKDAFGLFDVDHNGKISNVEIAKILGMDKRSKEINKIIEKYDTNKDGEIDFDEFYQMMQELS